MGPRQIGTDHAEREYAFDVGAATEGPAGPLHLAFHYDVAWIDRFAMFATIRLGGDRRYWPVVRAGVGPAITGGWICDKAGSATVCNYAVMLGLQLYGAD